MLKLTGHIKKVILIMLVLIMFCISGILVFFVIKNYENRNINPTETRAVDFPKGGNGSSNKPYLIYDQTDWEKMNEYSGCYFQLYRDITLINPTPINYYRSLTDTTYWSGSLDGDYHTITLNTDIYDPYGDGGILEDRYSTPWGLFAKVTGITIKNLKVTGYVKLKGHHIPMYVGGLIGQVSTYPKVNNYGSNSNITNCYVDLDFEVYDTDDYDGGDPDKHIVGGLIGHAEGADTTNTSLPGTLNISKTCYTGNIIIKSALNDETEHRISGSFGYAWISKYVEDNVWFDYKYTKYDLSNDKYEEQSRSEGSWSNYDKVSSYSNNFNTVIVRSDVWYKNSNYNGGQYIQAGFAKLNSKEITVKAGSGGAGGGTVWVRGDVKSYSYDEDDEKVVIKDTDNTTNYVDVYPAEWNYEYDYIAKSGNTITVYFIKVVYIYLYSPFLQDHWATADDAILKNTADNSLVDDSVEIKAYAGDKIYVDVDKHVATITIDRDDGDLIYEFSIIDMKYVIEGFELENGDDIAYITETITLKESHSYIYIYPNGILKEYGWIFI